MSRIWEINGLSLELDMEDYETSKNYMKAFEEMSEEEKQLKKDGSVDNYVKNYCLLFWHLYDRLFGEGTAEKIFEGKYNCRVCDEVYMDFLDFVKTQQTEAIQRRNNMLSQYKPPRNGKRS